MPERMDAAVPADAKNAPTGTWKTAQNAVSHSVHTHYSLVSGEEERRASETSVTRLTHGIPDTPSQVQDCGAGTATLNLNLGLEPET